MRVKSFLRSPRHLFSLGLCICFFPNFPIHTTVIKYLNFNMSLTLVLLGALVVLLYSFPHTLCTQATRESAVLLLLSHATVPATAFSGLQSDIQTMPSFLAEFWGKRNWNQSPRNFRDIPENKIHSFSSVPEEKTGVGQLLPSHVVPCQGGVRQGWAKAPWSLPPFWVWLFLLEYSLVYCKSLTSL